MCGAQRTTLGIIPWDRAFHRCFTDSGSSYLHLPTAGTVNVSMFYVGSEDLTQAWGAKHFTYQAISQPCISNKYNHICVCVCVFMYMLAFVLYF